MNMFKPVKAKDRASYLESIAEPRKSEIITLDRLIQKTVPTLKPNFLYNMLGYGTFIDLFSSNDIEVVNTAFSSERKGRDTAFLTVFGKEKACKYLNYKKETIDWPVIALASQKNYISLYVCCITDGQYLAERNKKELGKVSVGKSCIRFKKLEDLNLPALKKLLKEAARKPGLVN